MPTRVIREGILDSERVGKLSERAELFYRKIMSVVDDYGRFEYVPTVLRARLYSQRLETVTTEDIEAFMRECESGERPLVVTYSVNGKRYLEVREFNQQLKAKDSRYPGPPLEKGSVHVRTRAATDVLSRASPPPSSPTLASDSEEGCGEKPDEDTADFVQLFWVPYGRATGKTVTTWDQDESLRLWRALEKQGRFNAALYIPEYCRRVGEPPGSRFYKKPQAYLQEKPWTAQSFAPQREEKRGLTIEELYA